MRELTEEEWKQLQESKPPEPNIQQKRAEAKRQRDEAARIEAQKKQAELDKAAAAHYEKWKGYDGAAPSIR